MFTGWIVRPSSLQQRGVLSHQFSQCACLGLLLGSRDGLARSISKPCALGGTHPNSQFPSPKTTCLSRQCLEAHALRFLHTLCKAATNKHVRKKESFLNISVPLEESPIPRKRPLEGEGRPFPVHFSCFLSTVDFCMSGVTHTREGQDPGFRKTPWRFLSWS